MPEGTLGMSKSKEAMQAASSIDLMVVLTTVLAELTKRGFIPVSIAGLVIGCTSGAVNSTLTPEEAKAEAERLFATMSPEAQANARGLAGEEGFLDI